MNEGFLSAMLPVSVVDEIDHGLIVVDAQLRVVYANHAARCSVSGGHALAIEHGILKVHESHVAHDLRDAVIGAVRDDRRRLLCLPHGHREISVAVTRLGDPARGPVHALLLLQRESVCGPLALQGYARSHGLTPTETAVLERLARGEQAKEIAESHAVEISTVRTQISAIRVKTNARTIGVLLQRLALLPPMVPMLR